MAEFEKNQMTEFDKNQMAEFEKNQMTEFDKMQMAEFDKNQMTEFDKNQMTELGGNQILPNLEVKNIQPIRCIVWFKNMDIATLLVENSYDLNPLPVDMDSSNTYFALYIDVSINTESDIVTQDDVNKSMELDSNKYSVVEGNSYASEGGENEFSVIEIKQPWYKNPIVIGGSLMSVGTLKSSSTGDFESNNITTDTLIDVGKQDNNKTS